MKKMIGIATALTTAVDGIYDLYAKCTGYTDAPHDTLPVISNVDGNVTMLFEHDRKKVVLRNDLSFDKSFELLGLAGKKAFDHRDGRLRVQKHALDYHMAAGYSLQGVYADAENSSMQYVVFTRTTVDAFICVSLHQIAPQQVLKKHCCKHCGKHS